jgi:hypothetical protein
MEKNAEDACVPRHTRGEGAHSGDRDHSDRSMVITWTGDRDRSAWGAAPLPSRTGSEFA